MKRFVHVFVPIFIAVATLVVIARFQLGTTQESEKIPQMDVDRLFVKVNEDDTPETLAARVLEREHEFLVEVISEIIAGKITL